MCSKTSCVVCLFIILFCKMLIFEYILKFYLKFLLYAIMLYFIFYTKNIIQYSHWNKLRWIYIYIMFIHLLSVHEYRHTDSQKILQDISCHKWPHSKICYKWILLMTSIFMTPLYDNLTKHRLIVLYVYIYTFGTCSKTNDRFENHWNVNITLTYASIFWVGYLFLIQFDSPFLIWLSFVNSIWLVFSDLTRHFRSESTFLNSNSLIISNSIWLNFPNLIWLQLHQFYSPFLIWISFSDSVWLMISHPIRLSYLIWFDTHYTHLNHHFRFDSAIMVQFKSTFAIQF